MSFHIFSYLFISFHIFLYLFISFFYQPKDTEGYRRKNQTTRSQLRQRRCLQVKLMYSCFTLGLRGQGEAWKESCLRDLKAHALDFVAICRFSQYPIFAYFVLGHRLDWEVAALAEGYRVELSTPQGLVSLNGSWSPKVELVGPALQVSLRDAPWHGCLDPPPPRSWKSAIS